MNKSYAIETYYSAKDEIYQFSPEMKSMWINFFVCDIEDGRRVSDSQYLAIAYNARHLEEILGRPQGQYQRFFVIYREGGHKPLMKFLNWLVEKNYSPSLETSTLDRHAQESLEESSWGMSSNFYDANITVNWHFESDAAPNPDEAVFDERIILDWSWDYAGERVQFRGYWYVTSFAFLRKRLEEIDPYYRRFTIICPRFDKDMVDDEIHSFLGRYLCYINPADLSIYLKYHCEVDGDVNTYKR